MAEVDKRKDGPASDDGRSSSGIPKRADKVVVALPVRRVSPDRRPEKHSEQNRTRLPGDELIDWVRQLEHGPSMERLRWSGRPLRLSPPRRGIAKRIYRFF